MPNPNERIAEVFSDLANEVINEIVYLEDLRDLNPDVRRLSNINPGENGDNRVVENGNQGLRANDNQETRERVEEV
ncbi:MAG: hypothetical protein ACOCQO_01840 [Halanaerobiaceae bacterium]